jgi:hypothetical protein
MRPDHLLPPWAPSPTTPGITGSDLSAGSRCSDGGLPGNRGKRSGQASDLVEGTAQKYRNRLGPQRTGRYRHGRWPAPIHECCLCPPGNRPAVPARDPASLSGRSGNTGAELADLGATAALPRAAPYALEITADVRACSHAQADYAPRLPSYLHWQLPESFRARARGQVCQVPRRIVSVMALRSPARRGQRCGPPHHRRRAHPGGETPQAVSAYSQPQIITVPPHALRPADATHGGPR